MIKACLVNVNPLSNPICHLSHCYATVCTESLTDLLSGIVSFIIEYTQSKKGSYVRVGTHQGEAWVWCLDFKWH